MAHEPALTIGDMFKDKAMVKTIVAAVAGLVAAAFKVGVDDAMLDNVVTIIMFGAMALTPVFAQMEARKRSEEQAKATRDAVYAPATVADLVDDAARPTVDVTTHTEGAPFRPL